MEQELFYLRDSRANTGSSAMFWANNSGYTSDLNRAAKLDRERAIAQYKMRETDIPLRCDLVDRHGYLAVDMQNLPEPNKPSDRNCLLMRNKFDGNNVLFVTPAEKTFNFTEIEPVSMVDACALMANDTRLDCYNFDLIKPLARVVAVAELLNTKSMLRTAKIQLRKAEKIRKAVYRCCGESCGRFVTEAQFYNGCPNCDWAYCG